MFYNSELDVPNAVRPFCRVQEPVLPSSILGNRKGKVTCNTPPPSTLPLQLSPSNTVYTDVSGWRSHLLLLSPSITPKHYQLHWSSPGTRRSNRLHSQTQRSWQERNRQQFGNRMTVYSKTEISWLLHFSKNAVRTDKYIQSDDGVYNTITIPTHVTNIIGVC